MVGEDKPRVDLQCLASTLVITSTLKQSLTLPISYIMSHLLLPLILSQNSQVNLMSQSCRCPGWSTLLLNLAESSTLSHEA